MTGFSKVIEAFVKLDKSIILHNAITKITIPSNSYNTDFNMMNLKGFESLQEFYVGSDCFGGVESVMMKELNGLQSIVIGESSFFNTSIITIDSLPVLDRIELKKDSFHGKEVNSTLVLSNLPLLNSITSEGGSFVEVRSFTVIS